LGGILADLVVRGGDVPGHPRGGLPEVWVMTVWESCVSPFLEFLKVQGLQQILVEERVQPVKCIYRVRVIPLRGVGGMGEANPARCPVNILLAERVCEGWQTLVFQVL
jgi:hypothetical protein